MSKQLPISYDNLMIPSSTHDLCSAVKCSPQPGSPMTPNKSTNYLVFDTVVTPKKIIDFENIKSTPEHLKQLLSFDDEDVFLENTIHDSSYEDDMSIDENCDVNQVTGQSSSLFRSVSVKLPTTQVNRQCLHPYDYSNQLNSMSIPHTSSFNSWAGNNFHAPNQYQPTTDAAGSQSQKLPQNCNSNPENILLSSNAQSRISRIYSQPEAPMETVLAFKSRADSNMAYTSNVSDKKYIADYSREHILPIVSNKSSPIPFIDHHTLSELLDNKYAGQIDDFILVDCRFPYEYEGGHIRTAVNLYTEKDVYNYFIQCARLRLFKNSAFQSCVIVIFHCEYSKSRGPKIASSLRNSDRNIHGSCYPNLFYPEIYVLSGGYRQFFEAFPVKCFPPAYVPMNDDRFIDQCRWFKRSVNFSTDCYTTTGVKRKY